jgi:hypothetical protein
MGRTPPAEALFQGRGAGRSDECIEEKGEGEGVHTRGKPEICNFKIAIFNLLKNLRRHWNMITNHSFTREIDRAMPK